MVNCYCAFCRSPRRVYKKKHIGAANVGAALVAAALLMQFIGDLSDPRGVLLWVFFLGVGEAFVQIRWRIHLPCRRCGFDPVLYLKDPMKAANRVKETMERRKTDPSMLLATLLSLPTISKERSETLKKTESGPRGVLVSKKI